MDRLVKRVTRRIAWHPRRKSVVVNGAEYKALCDYAATLFPFYPGEILQFEGRNVVRAE